MAPAAAIDLPCDGDGVCMACKATPPEAEILLCGTCAAPWHAQCLSSPPASMSAVYNWQCPDCNPAPDAAAHSSSVAPSGAHSELVAMIRAIEADETLTEQEKARRRQALVGRVNMPPEDDDESDEDDGKNKGKSNDVLDLLDEKFNCAFCMQLPERPVSTPCGHNFCLKCFQKWVRQGGHTCVKCRAPFPAKMAAQPRINSALVIAIRMAKTARSSTTGGPIHIQHFIRNENRPEKAFTTERAKKPGKANACSGQIFVTVPPDHFGPILAENDPRRKQGVLVGETWEDRMECRQWGAHLPHVAGIAGQSDYGAQSVALSGGYKDDEDHGEWFLYTGSGGRDLSGNKRTNKEQSFDQKFEKLNAALKVSCLKGYPVRVVRSHKEKRSSYAPEGGVRYDGIYRIEKCWRKIGIQGFKVCRYLFVRCDNEPAPWTSDEYGDRPRPLPAIKELKNATDIAERQENPSWDYHEKQGWKWMKPPPASRKPVSSANLDERKYTRKHVHHTSMERLLKEFSCLICRKVMTLPVTTPCGHNFCQSCLLGAFEDKSFVRERGSGSGRTLRAKKIVKKCPTCPTDISDFLQNPQVNRELSDVIESLQRKIEEENMRLQIEANNDVSEGSGEDRSDDLQENVSREDKSRVMEMANEEINVGAAMKFTMQESGTVGDESKSLDGRSDVNPAVEGMGKAPMHEGTQSLLSQKRKSYPVQEPDSNKINLNEAAETSDGISTSEESDVENAMLHGSKENLDVNVLKSEMEEDAKVVVQNQVNDTELPVYGMRTRTVKKARKETDISEAQ